MRHEKVKLLRASLHRVNIPLGNLQRAKPVIHGPENLMIDEIVNACRARFQHQTLTKKALLKSEWL
jgi:hypothetical protein